MEIEEEIEKLIKEKIENMGYELKRVEIKQKGRAKELVITIDKKGGVTIDDCVKVSRTIEPLLDEKDFFQKRWYLTVSSPGIEI